MEESSEAHMESDVSSSTGDSQPAPGTPAPSRDLDTVIVVEPSDNSTLPKLNDPQKVKSPDKPEVAKCLPKSSQELTIKKIIIKRPVNPNIKLVQKSPLKSGESPEASSKDSTPKRCEPSSSEHSGKANTCNKTESPSNTVIVVDKVAQNTPVDSSNELKISPAKEVDINELTSTKSGTKDAPTTDVLDPKDVKEVCSKDSPVKDQLIKLNTEDKVVDISSVNSMKDSPGKVIIKESPVKIFLNKDQVRSSHVKDNSGKDTKMTPTKELQVKLTSNKEVTNKLIVIKNTPPKSSKEITIKQNPTKEPIAKSTPVKDCVVIKSTPTKEVQSKSVVKEQSVEVTPVKDSHKVTSDEKIDENETKTNEITSEDKEVSNDSQLETNSDTSEKEHNKSISRELRSLINSAKESKIISECTQLTSKTRKSRTPLDSSSSNLNASLEAEKIQGVRRGSNNSQKSNCSTEKSEKLQLKRSMRSQNPEFVSKVKNFFNSVSGKKGENEMSEDEVEPQKDNKEVQKDKKENDNELTPSLPKRKKTDEVDPVPETNARKMRSDTYCWRCHWAVGPPANEKAQPPVYCTVCPRVFHHKCLTGSERNKIAVEKNWVCPECLLILHAEGSETRSPAMKKISLGMLCDLLRHALDRMMEVNGVEPFTQPVDRTAFPDYDKYIVHPMDLSVMRRYIDEGLYGSTEAFLSDCQWILHNSIIFNTLQAKLTGGARALVRSCRAEMSEIEACPECYAAAHARRPTWFTDVCSTPHILLWAKLKGFPYWPAKGMSVNCSGLVDVRFFGAHDRAWVPARDCFLYSEKDPNNFRTKRQDILDSMKEAEHHIRNISRKYGKFVYPPFKTQFEPSKLTEQLKMMIPSFEGEVKSIAKDTPKNSPNIKDKRRSNSKSSKGSLNEGDTSEAEDVAAAPRKMADGAEIAKDDEDYLIDKDKESPMELEVQVPQTQEPQQPKEAKDTEGNRKRRRSDLQEAVITVIDSSKEKRKRVDNEGKDEPNKETKEPVKKDDKEPDKKETPKKTVLPIDDSVELVTTNADKKTTPKVTPIRVISISKVMKNATKISPKVSPPNEEDKNVKDKAVTKIVLTNEEDKSPAKQKKIEKAVSDKPTPQEDKKARRRNSKNKSLNNSNVGKADKVEKKSEISDKDKSKENNTANKSLTEADKSIKDRIHYDDDTSLAVLAREARSGSTSSLPTISNVVSLSETTGQNKPSQASSDSNVFTPTSTDNVKSMKEAVNKLQRLRGDKDNNPPPSVVGRVGVRAFARMASSPEPEPVRINENVEIKTEPIDVEESERQMQEKMKLMNAFKLRPVNPSSNLREVRINKVVVTPLAKKNSAPSQLPQIRPRAKKTFPQPKKSDEGRSELTSKNSMVYIPIQPPVTQAPVRGSRPIVSTPTTVTQKPMGAINKTTTNNNMANNNIVNTVTAPLVPSSVSTFSSATSSSPATGPTSGPNAVTPAGPTVGQVPSTVHTMPLITSVNGQWTFSLQPVLSVGGLDSAPSPPMMNGLAERPPALLPLAPGGPLVGAGTALVSGAPALVSGAPALVSGSPALVSGAPALLGAAPTVVPAVSAPVATTALSNVTSTPQNNAQLPRLQQRPAFTNPLDAPVGYVPPPSTVGPLTAKLNQNAVKLADYFRTLLEDSLDKLDEPVTQLTSVKLQLEQAHWKYQQEIQEIKHNHDLILNEMRSSFEKEKIRLIAEKRQQFQLELDAAVKQAKSKQWCANCNQEAQFYCCWNTSYCDYPCQRAHWATHYAVCTQQRTQDNNGGDSNTPEGRLQQAPENLPKTTAAPQSMGSKLTPSRRAQDHSPKPSIIVSMVEDNTGNPTMKCVGTFKPPAAAGAGAGAVVSPLIINKQMMNDEASKKVVTSGGYLIVGGSNSVPMTSSVTARRPNAPTAVEYVYYPERGNNATNTTSTTSNAILK